MGSGAGLGGCGLRWSLQLHASSSKEQGQRVYPLVHPLPLHFLTSLHLSVLICVMCLIVTLPGELSELIYMKVLEQCLPQCSAQHAGFYCRRLVWLGSTELSVLGTRSRARLCHLSQHDCIQVTSSLGLCSCECKSRCVAQMISEVTSRKKISREILFILVKRTQAEAAA